MKKTTLLDLFVVSNLAFLALDVYLAHSYNQMANPQEWTPVIFSAVTPPIFIILLLLSKKDNLKKLTKTLLLLIGFGSIFLGLAGMFFHLGSQFFNLMDIKSLVYTAPFAAPLAYVGLGFLILLNRLINSETEEWSQWIIFLALGGFFGNFLLGLCDHAQNGFVYLTEWIPVIVSAFGVGFLGSLLVKKPNRSFINLCQFVVFLQAAVGFLGFYFHLQANLGGHSENIFDNFVYGAPVFAPLLFVDLAVLAAFGLWDLRQKI